MVSDVYTDIIQERKSAYLKHKDSGTSCETFSKENPLWLPILVEEVGEVAKAMCDKEPVENLYKELIQVASVAIVWAEKLQDGMEEDNGYAD